MHKATGADDMDRSFATGLSMLASKVVLQLSQEVGLPVKLRLTNRGLQLPRDFRYSANDILSHIAVVGSNILICSAGFTFRAVLPGQNLKPYATIRPFTFYKGSFYLNLPSAIREMLPDIVEFTVSLDIDQNRNIWSKLLI